MPNIPFDDEYYYVMDVSKNHIGKLNKSSLKFEAIIDLGMNVGMIVDFRLYKNKLYLRNDNTLTVISLS